LKQSGKSPEFLLQGVINLISLPEVCLKVQAILEDPDHNRDQIAEVISKDPAMTTRVLRIVNSAFYCFPSPIERISLAVSIIGERDLQNLVLASSVVQSLKPLAAQGLDIRQFWKHSVMCGIAGRQIAEKQGIPEAERLFVAGLMHDIGKLLIYYKEPELARAAEAESSLTGRACFQVERELLGFDHAAVGGALAHAWGLPLMLQETLLYHHETDQAENYPAESRAVYLANRLANELEETGMEVHADYAYEYENFSLSSEQLSDVITNTYAQSMEIFEIICG